MPSTRIERALVEQGEGLKALQQKALGLVVSQDEDAMALAKLEAEVAVLAAEIGVAVPTSALASAPEKKPRRVAVPPFALSGVLSDAEAAKIDQEFGHAPAGPPWDAIDLSLVGIAGLVGAALDFLVVRVPHAMTYQGEWFHAGSPLTEFLRDHSVKSDNWLAKFVRVPFDRVRGFGPNVEGMGPGSHRLHSLGHDPLFGIIFGTLDILHGRVSGIDKRGLPFFELTS